MSYKIINLDKVEFYLDEEYKKRFIEENINRGIKNSYSSLLLYAMNILNQYEIDCDKSLFDMTLQELDGLFYSSTLSSLASYNQVFAIMRTYVNYVNNICDKKYDTSPCFIFFNKESSIKSINKYVDNESIVEKRFLTKYDYKYIIENEAFPLLERATIIFAWHQCKYIYEHPSEIKKTAITQEGTIKMSKKDYPFLDEDFEYRNLNSNERNVLFNFARATEDFYIQFDPSENVIKNDTLVKMYLERSDDLFRNFMEVSGYKPLRNVAFTTLKLNRRLKAFGFYIKKPELTIKRVSLSNIYNSCIDEYGYKFNYGIKNAKIQEKYGLRLSSGKEEPTITGLINKRIKQESELNN